MSVSLVSSASPSVSLSSSLGSAIFVGRVRGRLGGAARPATPPVLRACIWPARESDGREVVLDGIGNQGVGKRRGLRKGYIPSSGSLISSSSSFMATALALSSTLRTTSRLLSMPM